MVFKLLDSKIRNENLLNEFKGNVFEYLVASILARYYDLESKFVVSLGDGFYSQLSNYESYIRKHSPQLIKSLPLLAQELAQEIIPRITASIANVLLVGKVAGGGNDQRWGECDVMLVDSDGQEHPISIKLCKTHGLVNTKSGGIKSFYTKYFANFNVELIQQELNALVDSRFTQMAFKLHELVGLDYCGDFKNWVEEGFSELPGELPSEMRAVLFDYYHQIASRLFIDLKELHEQNRGEFVKALLPICGHGTANMIQAISFHGEETKAGIISKYLSKGIEIHNSSFMIDSLSEVEFSSLKSGISSFEILCKSFDLQIRVKPMNKFTAPALKVNCSIRYH